MRRLTRGTNRDGIPQLKDHGVGVLPQHNVDLGGGCEPFLDPVGFKNYVELVHERAGFA